MQTLHIPTYIHTYWQCFLLCSPYIFLASFVLSFLVAFEVPRICNWLQLIAKCIGLKIEDSIASSIDWLEEKQKRSGQQTEKHRMNLSGSYHKGYSQHLQYLDTNNVSKRSITPTERNGYWNTLSHWVLHMPPLWGTPNHSSPPYTSCNALSAGCNYSGSSATC